MLKDRFIKGLKKRTDDLTELIARYQRWKEEHGHSDEDDNDDEYYPDVYQGHYLLLSNDFGLEKELGTVHDMWNFDTVRASLDRPKSIKSPATDKTSASTVDKPLPVVRANIIDGEKETKEVGSVVKEPQHSSTMVPTPILPKIPEMPSLTVETLEVPEKTAGDTMKTPQSASSEVTDQLLQVIDSPDGSKVLSRIVEHVESNSTLDDEDLPLKAVMSRQQTQADTSAAQQKPRYPSSKISLASNQRTVSSPIPAQRATRATVSMTGQSQSKLPQQLTSHTLKPPRVDKIGRSRTRLEDMFGDVLEDCERWADALIATLERP